MMHCCSLQAVDAASLLRLFLNFDLLDAAAELVLEYVDALLGKGHQYFGIEVCTLSAREITDLRSAVRDFMRRIADLRSAVRDDMEGVVVTNVMSGAEFRPVLKTIYALCCRGLCLRHHLLSGCHTRLSISC